MKRFDFFQLGAYAAAAVLAVGGAFLVSLRYLGPVRAQDTSSPAQQSSTAPSQQGQPPAVEGGAQQPGQAPVNPANAASGGEPNSQSGIAEIEAFLEPFIYDVLNRRDPFLPYSEFSGQGTTEDTNLSNMSPSQRWDLEQLKLVGIMWDVRAPKAMFMDPEKEVMVLGRDESIGKRNGYIAAIREGEVVVVEAIRKRGDIIYKTKVLRIER